MERGIVAIDEDAIRQIGRARRGEPELRRIAPRGEGEPGELPGRGREAAARVVVDLDHRLAGAVEEERVLVAAHRVPAALRVEDGELDEGARHAGVVGEEGGVARLLLGPR